VQPQTLEHDLVVVELKRHAKVVFAVVYVRYTLSLIRSRFRTQGRVFGAALVSPSKELFSIGAYPFGPI
jgi:hypothetical protein